MAGQEVGQRARHAEHADGHTPADPFPARDDVGVEPELVRPAPVHRELGVGDVSSDQCSVSTSDLAQVLMEAGLRHHQSAVGHHRFEQHRCHVTPGERRVQRLDVIEGNRPDVVTGPGGQADAIRRALRPEHLVHVTVVLGIEDHHLLPAGEGPGDPKRINVRAGRRKRVLPRGKPEPFGEKLADIERISGGEEEVVALGRLFGNRPDDGLWSESRGHGQVAEVEVSVAVAVQIDEGAATSGDCHHGRVAPEALHPRHRDAVRHRRTGGVQPRQRTWDRGVEISGLCVAQLLERALERGCDQ